MTDLFRSMFCYGKNAKPIIVLMPFGKLDSEAASFFFIFIKVPKKRSICCNKIKARHSIFYRSRKVKKLEY